MSVSDSPKKITTLRETEIPVEPKDHLRESIEQALSERAKTSDRAKAVIEASEKACQDSQELLQQMKSPRIQRHASIDLFPSARGRAGIRFSRCAEREKVPVATYTTLPRAHQPPQIAQ